MDERIGRFVGQVLVQLVSGQHAGGELTRTEALGGLDRELSVRRRPPRLNAGRLTNPPERFFAAPQGAANRNRRPARPKNP